MSKKEIIEQFKNKISQFKDQDELEKALRIYIELAKKKAFDERYYFGNVKQARQSYQESVIDSRKPERVINKRKITCVSISSLYKAILNEIGIKCEIVKDDPEDDHVYPVLEIKDGTNIKADIQADMHRIQTRSKLKSFYPMLKSRRNFEPELTKMLIEIGYIENENDYRDKKIEKIMDDLGNLEDLDANKTLEKILMNENAYKGMQNIGIVEAYRYYSILLKKVKAKKDFSNLIYSFHCKNQKGEYTICMYSTDEKMKQVQVYLFSRKEGRFLPCDLNTLEELKKQGMTFGKTGRENGIKKLEKIIQQNKTKNKISKSEPKEDIR